MQVFFQEPRKKWQRITLRSEENYTFVLVLLALTSSLRLCIYRHGPHLLQVKAAYLCEARFASNTYTKKGGGVWGGGCEGEGRWGWDGCGYSPVVFQLYGFPKHRSLLKGTDKTGFQRSK